MGDCTVPALPSWRERAERAEAEIEVLRMSFDMAAALVTAMHDALRVDGLSRGLVEDAELLRADRDRLLAACLEAEGPLDALVDMQGDDPEPGDVEALESLRRAISKSSAGEWT